MKKVISFLIVFLMVLCLFAEKPLVHDVDAVAGKGTGINISWTLPAKSEKPLSKIRIYKSTLPITNFADIKDNEPLVELYPEETAYTDYVYDFKDYFYAVVAVTDKPYDLILPSINATIKGTHINPKIPEEKFEKIEEDKIYADGTLRETPLPFIDYVEGLDTKETISEEAVISAKKLAKKTGTSKKLTQYYFEEDLVSPDGGDDFLLFNILKNYFVQKKYNETITNLEKITGTNISEETRNRAIFYIGESYYFLGDYETAIRTFVKVETVYPTLAKKWITSALNLM